MKTVKKFTTFEEMKSFERKPKDDALSLKKHEEFERVIKEIKSGKQAINERKLKG